MADEKGGVIGRGTSMITNAELAAALALMLADPETKIATRRAVVIAAWLAQRGVEV